MKKGKLVSTVITNDTVLDFNVLSGGLGIRQFSMRNAGESILVIDDATREEIEPNEAFYLESMLGLVNNDFKLKFKGDGVNKAIVRYIVEIPKC